MLVPLIADTRIAASTLTAITLASIAAFTAGISYMMKSNDSASSARASFILLEQSNLTGLSISSPHGMYERFSVVVSVMMLSRATLSIR